MNILYIHGFGSKFSPDSEKIEELSKHHTVYGFNYDYTADPKENLNIMYKYIVDNLIDGVVGTSLGGWYAMKLAELTGLPVVAINPAVEPVVTLAKYIGIGIDWYGNEYELKAGTVLKYANAPKNVCALILIDLGDDVIDPLLVTKMGYGVDNSVIHFDGGSHRFDHMKKAIPDIKKYFRNAECSWGVSC